MKEARILTRLKFVKKNMRLCGQNFSVKNLSHTDWKRIEGRVLVEKARVVIGYSKQTANCDIFWSLKGLYEWIKENKI